LDNDPEETSYADFKKDASSNGKIAETNGNIST